MKVDSIAGTVLRCDSCRAIQGKKEKPVFKQFSLVKIDARTGQPIAGIAGESNPKMPAILHSCPGCEGKIKVAAMTNNPLTLPPGPLRDFFMMAKSKDLLRNLKLL